MKYIFIWIFYFGICQSVNAQAFDWAYLNEFTANGYIYTTAIQTFQEKVFICGDILGVQDMDPGPNSHLKGSANTRMGFVSCFSEDGVYQWSGIFGYQGYVRDIDIDDQGNIYCVGSFAGIGDFDPGAGVFELISQTNNTDGFILKLTNDGQFVWAGSIRGTGTNEVRAIACEDAYIYVVGKNSMDADFDFTNTPHTAAKGLFIAKYNLMGQLNFVKSLGYTGGSNHSIYSNEFDIKVHNESIYVVGHFTGKVDFDPGVDVYNLSSTTTQPVTQSSLFEEGYNQMNTFFLKINSSGDFVMAKQIQCHNPKIDISSNGEVMMTGFINGNINISLNQEASYISAKSFYAAKFNANLELLFAHPVSGGAYMNPFLHVQFLPDSGYMLSNTFRGEIDMDPSANIYSINCHDTIFNTTILGGGIFISRFNEQGDFLTAVYYGKDHNNLLLQDFYISAAGAIHSVGRKMVLFYSCDFNPGIGNFILSNGVNFHQKLNLCSAVPVATNFSANSYGPYTWNNQTYSNSGVYTQTYTQTQGCDSIVTLTLHVSKEPEFNIYPNPSINLEFFISTNANQAVTYDIFDTQNRLIQNGQLVQEITKISADHFSAGTYFVVFNGSQMKKFVKL